MFASPERTLMFDINDFDETMPGPWEWDVKRLAASFEVAAPRSRILDTDRRTMVLRLVRAYREAMRRFAEMKNLEVWYSRLDMGTLVQRIRDEIDQKTWPRTWTAAGRRSAARTACGLSRSSPSQSTGDPRIVADPPLIVPLERPRAGVAREDSWTLCGPSSAATAGRCRATAVTCWSGYELVDAARKVVGVGSVGTRAIVAFCWAATIGTRSSSR